MADHWYVHRPFTASITLQTTRVHESTIAEVPMTVARRQRTAVMTATLPHGTFRLAFVKHVLRGVAVHVLRATPDLFTSFL